ncbi:MAG: sensor histidine kinase protein [Verrucomicrobiales bacterium]|nr:sensor histidine kinase protein [Verrucomicrobiales bacterium]
MTPTTSSRPSSGQPLLGYPRAIILVFLAWILTRALRSLFGSTPGSLFFCAVILTAWRYGLGPAVLASLLSSSAIVFFLQPPAVSPDEPRAEFMRFGVFLFASVFISWLMARQKRIDAELQQARDDLERKVSERTRQLTTANAELKVEIGKRNSAESLLEGEKRVLEMIASGALLSESLDATIRLIESHAPGMLGSILLLDEQGIHLRHGAAPGLPVDYVRGIDGTAIGPNVGSCGTAACRNEAVFARDIATDPAWKDYRDLALRHGLKACWSTPIKDGNGKVLGTFAMYYRQPASPEPEHLRLIEMATHIASIAICRDRANAQLSQSEAKLKEAQRIGKIGYWERDLVADQITWSEETCKIFGVPFPNEGLSQARLQELIYPEDRQIQQEALEQTLRQLHPYDVEYRIVTPGAETRFVHVIDQIVCDESGRPIRLFGTVQDITERRRAEEALRRSERELRQVIDTVPVMAWTLRPEGVVDFLNRRWVDYSGISLEQYVADPAGPIHPEDAPRVFEKWRAQMAIGKAFDDEMRLRRADGEYRWFLVRTAPLCDQLGKIVKWFGVSTDIEDRKQAERVLFDTKSKLELILENSPLAISTLNPEGRITSWNKAAERLFGWTAGEAIGQLCKTIPPEGRQDYLLSIGKVMQGETLLGLVSYRRKKNRDILTCSVSFAPQRNERGEPIGVTAIIEDITERKRAEDAIRRSQELLESVLATIPVGVVVTNLAGDIVRSNAISKAIWGQVIISGGERREKSRAFWHETGKRVEPEDWASVRALANGQTILNELLDIEPFNGQPKTIRNSAAPIRNPDGQIVGAVIVNEDVTEAKKSEEKLRQAQAELAHVARVTVIGELTASIAHEVNQPLAAVVTNANAASRWLAADPPNLKEAREAILRIARDGTRASEVIRRIRTLVKKSEPFRTSVNLNELIEETVALTQPELKRKKVSLRTELSPKLPLVPADRVQLQQVLLNLFVNAVDSLSGVPDRPRMLRIHTELTESHSVQVVVQDTGAGIKRDVVERLFEPFYTTKPHGLGMGLAISRSIVEAHGGRLWATPNDGRGATFQLILPTHDGGKPCTKHEHV